MTEKMYAVKMGVRRKRAIHLPWEEHSFTVTARTPEDAKVSALMDAARSFPIDDWEYDHPNATIEEISNEQIEKYLDDRLNRITAEQPEKLRKVREDLASIGVVLPDPEVE